MWCQMWQMSTADTSGARGPRSRGTKGQWARSLPWGRPQVLMLKKRRRRKTSEDYSPCTPALHVARVVWDVSKQLNLALFDAKDSALPLDYWLTAPRNSLHATSVQKCNKVFHNLGIFGLLAQAFQQFFYTVHRISIGDKSLAAISEKP